MSKKLLLILAPLAAISQLIYASTLEEFFSKPLPGFRGYAALTEEFRAFVIFACLAIILKLILQPGTNQKNEWHKFWYWGFLATLALVSAAVIYVNPHGRFPWNTRSEYIELETRARKFELYEKIKRTPDVLLLGSSVALAESTTYFEEKWDLQAFNLSVTRGGPVDFVNLINVVKAKSPDSKMPSVVMVEMLDLSLGISDFMQIPIAYIPYLESTKQQRFTLWTGIRATLDMRSLSDALFTFFIIDQGRWKSISPLTENGTTIYLNGDKTKDEEYQKIVTKNIRMLTSLQTCESLNENGKAALKRLAELSRQYKFSLLLYRAPINEDFYVFSNTTPSDYAQCNKLFTQYVEGIVAENPNVFYRDLSQYKEIAKGGKDFYKDTHHLTANGSAALLNALSADFEQALQWARENRP